MAKSDTDHNKLEGKLVKSIEAKELGGLGAEYAELGLDSILDEGIVKDIPILRTLVSIAKAGLHVRDRLYIKKIIHFLIQISSPTQEQRQAFIDKYCVDTKRFEEAIHLILQQTDNMEKPALIGKIFRACILNRINFEDALVLSSMVNKALWQDLEAMFVGNDTDAIKVRLANCGLLHMSIKRIVTFEPENTDTSPCFRFTANSYTKKLIEIAKMV